MLKSAAIVVCTFGLCLTLGAQQVPPNHPQIPANHPPVTPQLPAGHPQIDPNAPAEPEAPPPANPEDVKSVDAIIKAYYACVSGPRGQKRDWTRLRSLMLPEAHFITTRPTDTIAIPMVLTIEQFTGLNGTYFEKGGYFEDEVHRTTDTYGNIAQVFSTYESRHAREETQPYSRGINSMQLINDGTRWWIVNVMWDFERPNNQIPERYQSNKAADAQ